MRKGADRWILTIALSLSILGVLMVFSSSTVMTASSRAFGHDPYFFLKRQLLFLFVGVIAATCAYKINLLRWRFLLGLPMVMVSGVLLAAVLVLGPEINGAHRWLLIGPFQFQPAEMAKLALMFYLADCLARRREKVGILLALFPPIFMFAVMLFLIEKEPDLGTGLVLAAVFMAMLFVAGARLEHLGAMACVGLVAVACMVVAKPYRMERLTGFLHPTSDIRGKNYQVFQSLLALGSGGPWGRGLGQGHQKYNYLPELHTDYIFAILGEELGLVGTLAVLMLFVCLLYKGFKVAVNCRRPYLRFLAAGITFQLCLQALLNVAVVSGSLPSTGIPLPFISYGGTSLLFCMIGIGLLLNVSDYNSRYRKKVGHRSRARRRVRRGATLASSSGEAIVAKSVSKSWERRVAKARLRRSDSRLPRPPIAPTLVEGERIVSPESGERTKVLI